MFSMKRSYWGWSVSDVAFSMLDAWERMLRRFSMIVGSKPWNLRHASVTEQKPIGCSFLLTPSEI